MEYTPVSALLVVKVVGHDADGAEDLAFLLHTLVEACAKLPNIECLFPPKKRFYFLFPLSFPTHPHSFSITLIVSSTRQLLWV